MRNSSEGFWVEIKAIEWAQYCHQVRIRGDRLKKWPLEIMPILFQVTKKLTRGGLS